jgi:diguanylate cyclase (GGDEF)-like protein
MTRQRHDARHDAIHEVDHYRIPGFNGGSADLAAALDEMGFTYAADWYASGLLYGAAGMLVVLLGLFNLAPLPRGIVYIGSLAMAIAVLCLIAGRTLTSSGRLAQLSTHARIVTGLVIYVCSMLILGDEWVAFALLPLLSVSVCYLVSGRTAAFYLLVAGSVVCVGLLAAGGPARVAHAVISTVAFMMVLASTIVIKRQMLELTRRNRRLAYTDPLTGIANMRNLREAISVEQNSAKSPRRPFALFAMDLDNFKEVNDRFDHSLGDRVLCAVAETLSEELNAGDLAARRGGDEFSVLVRDAVSLDLDELRDRLERAIARARNAVCPEVTPSGSVAYVLARPGEEIGGMLERADQALHDAKLLSAGPPRSGEAERIKAPPVLAGPNHAHLARQARTRLDRSARPKSFALTRGIVEADAMSRFVSCLFAVTGAAIGALAVTHMVEPLTPAAGSAIAAGFAVLALFRAGAEDDGVCAPRLHVRWIAAYCLIAMAIVLAGASGTALLDLLPEMVLCGFVVFRGRTALLYMFGALILYGGFAILGSFAYGFARTAMTTVVLAAVAALCVKLRLVTIRLVRANRELSELDALTGIGNVRALKSRVADVIERSPQPQVHPVLMAIDLDAFKQVNDLHSHTTGDRVLIAVARAVSERVRIGELVARRGGDEFFVVTSDSDPKDVEPLARRIEQAIATACARICPDLSPTASVTHVAWRPGETPEEFLHDADVALHAKKAESRLMRRSVRGVSADTPGSNLPALGPVEGVGANRPS